MCPIYISLTFYEALLLYKRPNFLYKKKLFAHQNLKSS